jgi:hypothetical protein
VGACNDLSPQQCRTVQIIEPDSTLLTATSSGSADASLDEYGSLVLTQGQTEADILFVTPKAGEYRFEYLYIDAFGVANPGNVEPVAFSQSPLGFIALFAGAPILAGHVLRWRVVVVQIGELAPFDSPQNLYLQLPQANLFLVAFTVPRSNVQYGFSELRIENLIDPPDQQTPILAQVVHKTQLDFTLALNPTPDSDNYFVKVRTP